MLSVQYSSGTIEKLGGAKYQLVLVNGTEEVFRGTISKHVATQLMLKDKKIKEKMINPNFNLFLKSGVSEVAHLLKQAEVFTNSKNLRTNLRYIKNIVTNN